MYYVKGKVTLQAHVDIPEGTCEEEYARRGFFGRTTHLYRRHAPVGWSDIEGELRPRAYVTSDLEGLESGDYLAGRIPLLSNEDVTLLFAIVKQTMPYFFRNADADEILFVHAGEGEIETDFGPLHYEKGDYLVIPRGTIYRLIPDRESAVLVITSTGEVEIPDRGIAGQHALFDPSVIRVPEPAPERFSDPGPWQVKVQRQGRISTITYPFNPVNAVGWKGDLTVWQLNIRDIRPIHSERYHLPPTAHITFLMQNAVICTFLPRPLETGDPGALKVPFFHNNIDFDEVIFYHEGEFFSRGGINPGMVTFHPQGIHHGPHPKAAEAAKNKERTNEKAVMIDTRRPLAPTPEAATAEVRDYWRSWMTVATEGGETR